MKNFRPKKKSQKKQKKINKRQNKREKVKKMGDAKNQSWFPAPKTVGLLLERKKKHKKSGKNGKNQKKIGRRQESNLGLFHPKEEFYHLTTSP